MLAYIARDSNNMVCLYTTKPEKGPYEWFSTDNFLPITDLLKNINPRWEDNEPIKVKVKFEKI